MFSEQGMFCEIEVAADASALNSNSPPMFTQEISPVSVEISVLIQG